MPQALYNPPGTVNAALTSAALNWTSDNTRNSAEALTLLLAGMIAHGNTASELADNAFVRQVCACEFLIGSNIWTVQDGPVITPSTGTYTTARKHFIITARNINTGATTWQFAVPTDIANVNLAALPCIQLEP